LCKQFNLKAPIVPNGTEFTIYGFSTQQMFLRNKTNEG